jgi:outer membrane protein assembly factor BamD
MNKKILLSALILAACDHSDEKFDNKTVEQIYNDAMDRFESKSFHKAAKVFSEVERQYPYSNWAVKAQLMSAFCYYESGKFDEAIEGFNVFIQLHPGHAEVPYALYMTGLSYYEQMPIVARDQEPALKGKDKFNELIERFPDTSYAKDAKLKRDFINNHLAAKEMDIGHYYQHQGSYLAATNRFQVVVKDYEKTDQVPEALYRLVECYLSLGLKDQATASGAVLGHNYPNTPWYKKAFDLLK